MPGADPTEKVTVEDGENGDYVPPHDQSSLCVCFLIQIMFLKQEPDESFEARALI